MSLISKLFNKKKPNLNIPPNSTSEFTVAREKKEKVVIPPGRISVHQDSNRRIISWFRSKDLVSPSFRTELIPLLRDLYKVNPDVGIALQDMFKLVNTGHIISFPNNSDSEAKKFRDHLEKVSDKWTSYTAGVYGLSNKMIVQCLIGGAISIEAVPKSDLSGISTIVFINPEEIIFERISDGVYHPYQINKGFDSSKEPYIKLNTSTYKYVSIFNDTDEPYGVPPFMGALDSIKTQADMRDNMKHILELMGLFGFLEAKMQKDQRRPNESESAYEARLKRNLTDLKRNLYNSLRDGIVVGYIDDHEFNLNSTTQSLNNVDKIYDINQQSVANGLGVNGNIIGVNTTTSEGGTSMLISKMISQLKNLQTIVSNVWEFIYSLELLLAGFDCKGVKVSYATSTITDEVKYQQSQEYKIRNLVSLYNQGIISQEEFAFEMGYSKPYLKKPLIDPSESDDANTTAKKRKREEDKDKSDRKTRDKNNPAPVRKDGDTKER